MNADGTTPTRSRGYSPLDCLAGLNRKFPELLPTLDCLRANAQMDGNRRGMPAHWYLPFHTTAKTLNDLLGRMGRMGMEVQRVARSTSTLVNALAAWRLTQGIYRFDATPFNELCATPVTGALPTEPRRESWRLVGLS
ncbi:hypothetical protein [Burkholderia pyrrocinia]|uniref:hypothetical protein n=1 Tax=Burkholderia pyrrocinia TaxID=60550 RepID=UPI00158C6E94|nr:hypothetical protein [Burkholderia pyrrocinia]